jgi:hypothetical protein
MLVTLAHFRNQNCKNLKPLSLWPVLNQIQLIAFKVICTDKMVRLGGWLVYPISETHTTLLANRNIYF